MTQLWNVDPTILSRRSVLISHLDIDTVRQSLATVRNFSDALMTKQGKAEWRIACSRVGTFAGDLRASLGVMGLAIYCANVLRLRRGDPATSLGMSRNLEFVMQQLGLTKATPGEALERLSAVAVGLAPYNRWLAKPDQVDDVVGAGDNLVAWKNAIDVLVTASEGPDVPTAWDEPAIEDGAWESWHERLTAHFLGDAIAPMEAASLLAPPRRGLEHLSIPFDDMTLLQWTSVLSNALASTVGASGTVPPSSRFEWLALAGLVKLGFIEVSRELSSAIREFPTTPNVPPPAEAHLQRLDAMSRVANPASDAHPRLQRILVVTNGTNGPGRWKSDPEYAAMVGDAKRLGLVLGALDRLKLRTALEVSLVMLQVPRGGNANRVLDETRKAFESYTEIANVMSNGCTFLVSEATPVGPIPKGGRVVTNATTLRDAVPTEPARS